MEEKTNDLVDPIIVEFCSSLNNEQTATFVNILNSLGYFKMDPETFNQPEEKTASKFKQYQELGYISYVEATRCDMLIRKLRATIKFLNAQTTYFDAMSELELENELWGFDLSL